MPGSLKALVASTTPNFNTSGLVPSSVFQPSIYAGNGGSLTVTNNLNMASEEAERYQYYGNFISETTLINGFFALPGLNNVTYTVSLGPSTSLPGGVESDFVTILINAFSNSVNELESILWARQIKLSIPGGNTSGGITGLTATTDNQGNLFVATAMSYGTGNANNTWIFKYNSSGVLQWQVEVFDQNLVVTSLTCDSAGNVYAAIPSHSTGLAGLVILKYSNSGTLLSTFNYGFTYTVGNNVNVINNNPGGTVTSAPTIDVRLDIDNVTGNIWALFYTSVFSQDIPLSTEGYSVTFGYATISSAGAVIASKLFPAPITNSGSTSIIGLTFTKSMVVDSAGNMYAYMTPTGSGNTGYLTKVNPNGTIAWTFALPVEAIDISPIAVLAVDSSNNLYFGGLGSSLTSYLIKLNPAGTILWQAKVNSFSILSLQLDTNNNVYMGGIMVGGVSSGGSSTTTETYGYIYFTPTGNFLGSPSTIDTMPLPAAIDSSSGIANSSASLVTMAPSTITATTIVPTTGGLTAANSTLGMELALNLTGGSLTDSANTSLVNYFCSGTKINDVGFLIWIMNRTTGSSALFDNIRGLTSPSSSSLAQYMKTSPLGGEITATGSGITNPSNSGFGVGNLPAVNTNGDNYVAWTFLAEPGFFDIVTYQGASNGTTITVPHQLGAAPALILLTSTSNELDWVVWANSPYDYMFLNKGNSLPNANPATFFGNGGVTVAPTSTNFTVGTAAAVNGESGSVGFSYIAYLFANQPGVTKIGTYVGNGVQQSINCQFNGGARFIMIGGPNGWFIFDTVRGIAGPTAGSHTPYLQTNAVVAETTNSDDVFPAANGFAVEQGTAAINTSGVTYVFFAIA